MSELSFGLSVRKEVRTYVNTTSLVGNGKRKEDINWAGCAVGIPLYSVDNHPIDRLLKEDEPSAISGQEGGLTKLASSVPVGASSAHCNPDKWAIASHYSANDQMDASLWCPWMYTWVGWSTR